MHIVAENINRAIKAANRGESHTISLHDATVMAHNLAGDPWISDKRHGLARRQALGLNQVGEYNPRPSLLCLIIRAVEYPELEWSVVFVELRHHPSRSVGWILHAIVRGRNRMRPAVDGVDPPDRGGYFGDFLEWVRGIMLDAIHKEDALVDKLWEDYYSS
jgi:hypothetical protein